MGLAEDFNLFAAVRALQIGVVLNEAQHRNVHHVGHLHSFGNDHRHQILGGGNNDHTVDGQALEYSQGHVAGSGRHIYEHIVHVFPDHIGPELLHRAGDDRAAPHNRIGGVV